MQFSSRKILIIGTLIGTIIFGYFYTNKDIFWPIVSLLAAGLIAFLVFYYQNDIVTFLFNSLALDRLSHYENVDSTLSLSGFFIQLLIATYCLVYYKITIKRDAKNIVFYNLMFLGVIFQMFTPIIGEFFRLSLYFNVFNIILIPNVLMSKNQNNTRALEYLSLLFIFLMYFTFSSQGNIISEYKFFWQ